MNRIVAFAAAFTTSALLFLATTTPALAQGSAGYTLVPVAAPASGQALVSSDVIWKRAGEGYVAPKANSRAAIVCAQAAKKIGKVASFTADGQSFDEAALAKCNEKAK
ncbi:CC_3452 family protein [Aquisediminimonas profunda]|uniref:CC_3452 family protein n=1 Tax=Aquisediminimonas profunda TaxID=1550733 RepID=UPI001C637FC5|nr:hypothetical protein [Aquisediminimonas profunda]